MKEQIVEGCVIMFKRLLKTIGVFLALTIVDCQRGPEFHIIHFAQDTQIVEADSALLYENMETLEENGDVDVELAGYTDTVGPYSFNLELSQARADTIKSWLVQHGVNSTRLTTVGYGEANSIGDNRTAEGRALNNRVEFIHK
jgi:outer membrane protein OmpA-like peptidoglycan-associated protein